MDFNLTNAWGIRAVADYFDSDDSMAETLLQGDIQANVLIAKTYDLMNPQNQIVYLDLDNYINDPTWGAQNAYRSGSPFEAFAPKPNEATARYSLPLAFDAGLIYYRTEWAKELGLEAVPLGWDDFVSQMQAGLTANLNDNFYVNNGTGGLLLSKSVLSAQSWYAAYGGTYSFENRVLKLDDSALDASFRALKQLLLMTALGWFGTHTLSVILWINTPWLIEGTLSELNQQTQYLPEKTDRAQLENHSLPTQLTGKARSLSNRSAWQSTRKRLEANWQPGFSCGGCCSPLSR
jgi:ABC-type glycerol-3-phosphate transport system substrate-binding protein